MPTYTFEEIQKMPIVQFYANAPAEIYEIAKNTNPMLKKMIDAARAVVNCKKEKRKEGAKQW